MSNQASNEMVVLQLYGPLAEQEIEYYVKVRFYVVNVCFCSLPL